MPVCVEEAGNALGATVVHAMWHDALQSAAVISTDASRGPPREDGDSLKLVGCRTHCRRGFFEAAICAICKSPVGIQRLMRIRAIYAADSAFGKLPPAKRKLTRAEHLRPCS